MATHSCTTQQASVGSECTSDWGADLISHGVDIPAEDLGLNQPERDEERLEVRETLARLFVPGQDKPDNPRLIKVATTVVRRWNSPAAKMRWLVLRDQYAKGWRVYFVDGSEHPGLIDRSTAEPIRTIACELLWLGIDVRACLIRNPWLMAKMFHGIAIQSLPPAMTESGFDARTALWCHFLKHGLPETGSIGQGAASGIASDGVDYPSTGCTPDIFTPDTDSPRIVLYSIEAVERLRAEDRYAKEMKLRMERLLDGMIMRGGLRPLALVPEGMRQVLDQLAEDFPNFAEVVATIRNQLMLRTLGGPAAVAFPPLLLGGNPGLGKTLFSRELAKCLGLPFRRIGFESAQNGSALSGSSSFWSNGSPGDLAMQLIGKDHDECVANPLILLDELDKIHPGLEYNPAAGLYPLLEKHTAAHWQDQCLPIALDASHVCWIGTANVLERIDIPILSRFQVFEVPDLTPGQARAVALRIYGLIRTEEPFGRHFAAELDDRVLDHLGSVAPRELRKALIDAMGRAAFDGRRHIQAEDVPRTSSQQNKHPFGFCQ